MKDVDTAKIKSTIDMRDLAAGYVELQRETPKELSGPCPKCGGVDRFHCQATWFFCRQCHPERGDAIEFMRWLHGCDFREACQKLGAADSPTEPLQRRPENSSKGQTARWQSSRWQADAQREVKTAIERLNTPEGEKGRQYLLSRGLQPETWQAWQLGYTPNLLRHKKVDGAWVEERLGPAVTLPWTDGKRVKAVQYRLLNHPTLRYWQKAGGDRTLFGVHLQASRPVLLICEGELNAASFWQVGHDQLDVVSFGCQDNIRHAGSYLRQLACNYGHVLLWADKGEQAVSAIEILGCKATPVKSPFGMDGNDLLRDGVLGEVLSIILRDVCGLTWTLETGVNADISLAFPANASVATIHGKWRRLDDGSIEATYTRAELLWARVAMGYEPSAQELAVMAEL